VRGRPHTLLINRALGPLVYEERGLGYATHTRISARRYW